MATTPPPTPTTTTKRANSLWKGELGVTVPIADLNRPENARMPFFE